MRNTLEHDVDALTYQFFVIARPARGPQLVNEGLTLVERQRARMDELEAAIAQGGAYARHLEEQLAAKNARLLEIEAAVAGAERERVTSEARLQEAERVVVNAAQELAARDQRLAEMEQVLADPDAQLRGHGIVRPPPRGRVAQTHGRHRHSGR